MFRSVLVPVFGEAAFMERQLAGALSLCRRVGAHMRVIYVEEGPAKWFAAFPGPANAGLLKEAVEAEIQIQRANALTRFESFCVEHAIGTTDDGRLNSVFATWTVIADDIETCIALNGRVSDLIVLNRPRGADARLIEIFNAAVFSTGRPTLLLPERPQTDLLNHVVIAWNGGLEIARLVGHAIPLLHEAKHVSIISAPTPHIKEAAAAGVADYLLWHNVRVAKAPYVHESSSVGGNILATARNIGASMILLGAYQHSRVRQLFLGDVTRFLLDEADMALLMEH